MSDFGEVMSVIRTLRLIVGLGLMVCVVPFLISKGCKEDARYESNRIPLRKLATAQDMLRLWGPGIFPKNKLPFMRPAQVTELLQDVVASRADAEVKNEAVQLLNEMEAHRNYFAFAGNFHQFASEIDSYLAPYRALENVASGAHAPVQPEDLQPKFLVISLGHRESAWQPDDQVVPANELFLDAEMIEACGDRIALKPTDVRTVIVLEWRRTQIGDYKLEVEGGTNGSDDEVKRNRGLPGFTKPMYKETCLLSLFDHPTGKFLSQIQIECRDPLTLKLGLGARSASGTGFDKLRQEVKQSIAKLVRVHPSSEESQ